MTADFKDFDFATDVNNGVAMMVAKHRACGATMSIASMSHHRCSVQPVPVMIPKNKLITYLRAVAKDQRNPVTVRICSVAEIDYESVSAVLNGLAFVLEDVIPNG
jgi:hypothetical protein